MTQGLVDPWHQEQMEVQVEKQESLKIITASTTPNDILPHGISWVT